MVITRCYSGNRNHSPITAHPPSVTLSSVYTELVEVSKGDMDIGLSSAGTACNANCGKAISQADVFVLAALTKAPPLRLLTNGHGTYSFRIVIIRSLRGVIRGNPQSTSNDRFSLSNCFACSGYFPATAFCKFSNSGRYYEPSAATDSDILPPAISLSPAINQCIARHRHQAKYIWKPPLRHRIFTVQ